MGRRREIVMAKSYFVKYMGGSTLYAGQSEGLLEVGEEGVEFKGQNLKFKVPIELIIDVTTSESDDPKKAAASYVALGMLGPAVTRSMSKIRIMRITFADSVNGLQMPEFRFLPKSINEVEFMEEAAAALNKSRGSLGDKRGISDNLNSGAEKLENLPKPRQTPVLYEPQIAPSPPPYAPPSNKSGSKKKIVIALALIVGIIAMVVFVSYSMAQTSIVDAASKFTTTTGNMEITNLSLSPLSADLRGEIIIRNPSGVDFVIDKAQADLYVKYGSDISSLGTMDVSDKALPSNGYVTLPVTMHIGSDLMNFLSTHTSGYSLAMSGNARVSGKSSFWTITYERSLSVEQSIDTLSPSQSLYPFPSPTQTPWYTFTPQTPTPAPTQNPEVGFSRSNPAPIGTTVDLSYQYFSKTYYFRITVTQVVRGSQAWSMLQEANMYNSPANAGFEYVLAKIRFEYYLGPTPDTQYSLSTIDFDAISKSGVTYNPCFAVQPEPSLTTSLYPGASHEGWATFQVFIEDSGPLLAFGRALDGTGGVWFSLSQASSAQA